MKSTAGGVEGALLFLRVAWNQRPTVFMDVVSEHTLDRRSSQRRGLIQISNDLAAQQPKIVHVSANGFLGKAQPNHVLNEGPETSYQSFARRQIFFPPHPGAWPALQIPAVGGNIQRGYRLGAAVYRGGLCCGTRARHGTDHDSKPLPSFSGIRLPACSIRSRQEKYRNCPPAPGWLGGRLLRVPETGARLRSSPGAEF